MTPEQQLRSFVARFAPPHQRLIRALRRALRRRFPAANELVYDNYNFLVIAYCPTERVSDSYFSIGADKNGANLFFGYTGTRIADPERLLLGGGASNRFVRLTSADVLERPAIRALMASSIGVSRPMGDTKGKLIIRSISPKRRPRRATPASARARHEPGSPGRARLTDRARQKQRPRHTTRKPARAF